MNTFKTIYELIAFVDSIPEKNFIARDLGKSPEAACVMGHINHRMYGFTTYWPAQHADLRNEPPSVKHLRDDLGVIVEELVYANNNHKIPKQGALEYLHSLLPKEESTVTY